MFLSPSRHTSSSMNVCMQLHDGGALDSPRANFPGGTVKSSEAAAGSNPREFCAFSSVPAGGPHQVPSGTCGGSAHHRATPLIWYDSKWKKNQNISSDARSLTRWFLISEAAETLTQIHARSISFLAAVLPQTQFDLLFLFFFSPSSSV